MPQQSVSERFVRRPRAAAVALAIVLGAASLVTTAEAALSLIGKSEVSFRAAGPGGLKIDGKGSNLSASETNGVLTVTTQLQTLKTGIGMRDNHMRKALNVAQHPLAKLAVPRSALKFPANDKSVAASAQGKFTLNGVTRDVKFDYEAKRTGSDYHVEAKTQIDMKDYKIEPPCYLGVCVDKDVKVKVQFKLREQ